VSHTPPVIVVGAGGHAWVVADALMASGRQVLGFVDKDAAKQHERPLDLPVLGPDAALDAFDRTATELANGIGSVGAPQDAVRPPLRRLVQQRLEAAGWRFATVRHPSAVVSAHATLEAGAQVLAGSVVQAAAHVGAGAIVNTRAVVEHHSRIGPFTHIAPGAVVCGDVVVGADCFVGAAAVVRQGLRLGDRVVVAMGAAVTRHVDAGVVAGVPATPLGAKKR
jgi:sugar O-acyltransferase (sialic acid O-acetyltransferase NeuD family)